MRSIMADLTIGAPLHHHNLTLFPLFWPHSAEPPYLVLQQAIEAGEAVVEEVSEAGNVPNLLLHNKSHRPVLISEGDILMGAKQNRVVNVTVLVAARTKFTLPVSCVEQGRWRYTSKHFTTCACAPPSLRSKKTRSVQRNRARSGRAMSDQGEVWDEVTRNLHDLKASSRTASLTDSYPWWNSVAQLHQVGGDPQGKIWQPGECDAPLRNHDWFWHPKREASIYSLAELVEMYYRSVGRGCNLCLNGNIDRDGLVPQADLKRLREFGDEIRRRFGKSLAETSGRGQLVELPLAKSTVIDHAIVMEQIAEGQRVRQYVIEGLVDGKWRELCRGRSIGHKRIERFAPIAVAKIRLRITESVAEPQICKLAVYHVG
jgi:hypothetical protein